LKAVQGICSGVAMEWYVQFFKDTDYTDEVIMSEYKDAGNYQDN
jgi:hypothetical protein